MPLDHAAGSDQLARTTALTAIDRTLLVEAGAGSGKTSVLAGRVAMLLASGRSPASIAAISFTELSAAELRERVTEFVHELMRGHVRPDLAPAFPDGAPSPAQVEALARASTSLDALACSTIHGFCRTLLTPYPVEAGIDPGASMLDQGATELLFEETYDAWLRARLSGPRSPDDAFAGLYMAEPGKTNELLRTLAKAMREHRTCTVAPCAEVADEIAAHRACVAAFRAFLTSDCPDCTPERIDAACRALEGQLAELENGQPEAATLPGMVQLSVPPGCSTKKGEFSSNKTLNPATIWKELLGGGKATEARVKLLQGQASEHLDKCRDAHDAIRTAAAGRALHLLALEAQDILANFTRAKLESAVLDFGDLLEKARLMLTGNDEVRRDLSARYGAILVDEFQDTDPDQMEILWRLCAEPQVGQPDVPWRDWALRPGALFLVGDPKQSIYRFRGGDLATYQDAKQRITQATSGGVVHISRNFRSRPGVLEWVNQRFQKPMEAIGYTPLETDMADALAVPAVAAIDVECSEAGNLEAVRDCEAERVAALCAGLVGNFQVRGRDGTLRPCEPCDIALLAPGAKELWRYERALEDQGLSVAAQAGKGFYRRQEIQDLIALTRVLADSRDTLALGALLRGPFVGLTDEVLLDAVEAHAAGGEGALPRLSLQVDPDRVPDPLLASRLRTLTSLARDKRRVTPHIMLCRAVEELNVRAVLRQRGGRLAERALANLDLFLELARPYDVRGLKAFSDAMRRQWEDAEKAQDARPDADRHSVNLITMHSAKGLEWPVVIPVNTASHVHAVVDRAVTPGRIHMKAFGTHPVGCEEALQQERREKELERQRVWYVAATRARDLLLLPRLSEPADRQAWIQMIPFGLEELPVLDEGAYQPRATPPGAEPLNPQDRATYVREADAVMAATPKVVRVTPHLVDADAEEPEPVAVVSEDWDEPTALPVQGSRQRGSVLHKLMEEILSGELAEAASAIAARGAELVAQLGAGGEKGPDPSEMAEAVLRGLGLPEIVAVRDRLHAELPVSSRQVQDGVETLVFGVADAVAIEEDGASSLVVDWKSDVNPSPETVLGYRGQVAEYLAATGTPAGIIVFLTSGRVEQLR